MANQCKIHIFELRFAAAWRHGVCCVYGMRELWDAWIVCMVGVCKADMCTCGAVRGTRHVVRRAPRSLSLDSWNLTPGGSVGIGGHVGRMLSQWPVAGMRAGPHAAADSGVVETPNLSRMRVRRILGLVLALANITLAAPQHYSQPLQYPCCLARPTGEATETRRCCQ